ncbi:MAG: hypothetical protein R3D25_02200 [Geminicoccaceae bacterium]
MLALVVAALARILAGTTLALPGLLHLAATAWIWPSPGSPSSTGRC